ncbi:MAG: hypothetical protein RMJ98_05745 [Myxococcales bacterium]|nr:hypothetical protein [Polyangiaceae bacterium]MDW8248795.1 hypothetical protein [Myxococcales bacterium]
MNRLDTSSILTVLATLGTSALLGCGTTPDPKSPVQAREVQGPEAGKGQGSCGAKTDDKGQGSWGAKGDGSCGAKPVAEPSDPKVTSPADAKQQEPPGESTSAQADAKPEEKKKPAAKKGGGAGSCGGRTCAAAAKRK